MLRPEAVSAARSPAPDGCGAQGERLCAGVLDFAGSAPVRAVHWFLGPRGTLIAESAWGRGATAVLVGWVPHEDDSPQSPQSRAGEAVPHTGQRRSSLPGALLLGVFDMADAARRLAELVPESGHDELAVVGRWALPDGCPPLHVRAVVHPEPGVLRRELVLQVTEALVRVQESAGSEGCPLRTQDARR